MKIVRIILTLGLVVGVYFESGIVTSVSMFLIFIAIEFRHLPLKADRRFDLQTQINSVRSILAAHWNEIIKIIQKLKDIKKES